jgi:amino-acid N-acetyltransferase
MPATAARGGGAAAAPWSQRARIAATFRPDAHAILNLVFPHTFVPWFRTVAPYIHAYHGKTFVVAIAGELIAAGKLASFAQDLAILQAMGIRLVLVHGFRPQVNEQLSSKGHTSRFSHGMRITDPVALDSAQEAAGQLRFEIEAAFSQGLPNTPMANAIVRVVSGNFLTARPIGVVDGVDFMHSGVVRKVDAAAIRRAIDFGAMVLLSPFGFSPTGEAFNLTMEDVATSTAIALQSDKLLFMTEVRGIHEDLADPESPIDTELALADAEKILGSLPAPQSPSDTAFYLRHCVRACRGGVERSHILPFAVDGALLMEVFTHDGIGTMVVDEKLESLREATADDIGGVLQLIEPFERDGTLVKRDRTEIERDIGNYTVIEHDGVIFGCAALYPYPEARTGEMAALTVSSQVQGQGDGERILKRVEQRARALGLESIFVLTTRTMHWFIKRGFVQVDADWLPEARKRKYNWDRRSQVFVKKLA